MALHRRRHNAHKKNRRGTLLAFIAVTVQAMLPFFIAGAMLEATNPAFAAAASICGTPPAGHHGSGTTGNQNSDIPLCAAVAAGQSFVAPPAPMVPLPISCRAAPLFSTKASRLASVATSSYQSRGPPAIA